MSPFRPLMVALALTTCGRAALAAPSPAVERSYPVGAFHRVAAAGVNLVIVRVGGAPSVRATGPAETLDKMEVVVDHENLRIRPRKQFSPNFDWRGLKPATYTLTQPRLTDASLAGSGNMRIDRADGDRLGASVAGSGNLDIAALRVARANFSIAGSGNLSAKGSATRADLSGTAELTVKQKADVSIIGSGDAQIAGGAHCTLSRIGSGRAHCGR